MTQDDDECQYSEGWRVKINGGGDESIGRQKRMSTEAWETSYGMKGHKRAIETEAPAKRSAGRTMRIGKSETEG